MGPVKIGHNANGGSGSDSASIYSHGTSQRDLGGSLIGGSKANSGEIPAPATWAR